MNILVLGGNGQLGQCLQKVLRGSSTENHYTFLGSDECDILSMVDISSAFDDYAPQVVINCAAYTNVDNAETNFTKAYAINATGVKNIAEYCKGYKAHLIHISTDYVFSDGMGRITEDTPTQPCNVYGITKDIGEKILKGYLKDNYTIIRTSWLYSEFGNNFITKILSRAKTDDICVVDDEVGHPTYAVALARRIIDLIESGRYRYSQPIFHFTDGGKVTRYELAKKACELYGIMHNVSKCRQDEIIAIAPRPQCVCLDFNMTYGDIPQWDASLEECINAIKERESVN